MDEGRVYPNLNRIQEVSLQIAIDTAKYAFERDLCHVYPKPSSIRELIKSKVYDCDYQDSLKPTWDYPKLWRGRKNDKNLDEEEKEKNNENRSFSHFFFILKNIFYW